TCTPHAPTPDTIATATATRPEFGTARMTAATAYTRTIGSAGSTKRRYHQSSNTVYARYGATTRPAETSATAASRARSRCRRVAHGAASATAANGEWVSTNHRGYRARLPKTCVAEKRSPVCP